MKILLTSLLLPVFAHANLNCLEKDHVKNLKVKILNSDYVVIDAGEKHLEIGGITKTNRHVFGTVITSYVKENEFKLVGVIENQFDPTKSEWTLSIPEITDKLKMICR